MEQENMYLTRTRTKGREFEMIWCIVAAVVGLIALVVMWALGSDGDVIVTSMFASILSIVAAVICKVVPYKAIRAFVEGLAILVWIIAIILIFMNYFEVYYLALFLPIITLFVAIFTFEKEIIFGSKQVTILSIFKTNFSIPYNQISGFGKGVFSTLVIAAPSVKSVNVFVVDVDKAVATVLAHVNGTYEE